MRRIIYLGGRGFRGLTSPPRALTAHGQPHEVGDILALHGPPTIEFRASIIVGSGSLSFELIRSLVNRLPVMVTPRWVRTSAQPIGIGDVVAYLLHGLAVRTLGHLVVEIGGPSGVPTANSCRSTPRQNRVRRWWFFPALSLSRAHRPVAGLVTPPLRARGPES